LNFEIIDRKHVLLLLRSTQETNAYISLSTKKTLIKERTLNIYTHNLRILQKWLFRKSKYGVSGDKI